MMEPSSSKSIEKGQRLPAFLGWLTRSCVVIFILLLTLLHFVDPSLDPIRTAVSEYAIGAAGPMMVSAFIVLGIGTMALAIGLYLSTPRTRATTIAFLLLILSGLFILLAGVFVSDPAGAALTPAGTVHAIASLSAFVLIILAMIQWTRVIESTPRLKRFSRASARLTFVTSLLFVLFLLSSGFAAGLVQRLFVSSILIWQLYATTMLLA